MKLTKHLTLILLIVVFNLSNLFSQKPRIENIQFYFDKSVNEVIITYDFKDYSQLETYEVVLTFKDGNNLVVIPKSVSGDIGKNIVGGEKKKINWDVFSDVNGLSVTARPFVEISSVKSIPLDPSLELIMNKIDKSTMNKFNFKFKRDGVMLLGVGSGIGAIIFKVKGNNYIDQQNMAINIDEYNLAGEKAKKCFTVSKISGGVSIICIGYGLYQYIRADKPGQKKQALSLFPDINNGVSVAFTHNF